MAAFISSNIYSQFIDLIKSQSLRYDKHQILQKKDIT